ncbi:MAG: LysM peptidoglycan-binding domain-containing protein [Mesorhizobium sp.]|uniref:LysM peptidoglycan-binding domain-containing protein n=1 Tax=Mesorhizobium sp. TaxID=1871066 RepID=UPI000FE9937E|nr:LysM peptidoglycan-binding domain-containing protein [Mesorhizobium sp.]RWI54748.1 MAG: LysM peptidoglycan-binding domain-containing protein [Mesorhizobium sp.]
MSNSLAVKRLEISRLIGEQAAEKIKHSAFEKAMHAERREAAASPPGALQNGLASTDGGNGARRSVITAQFGSLDPARKPQFAPREEPTTEFVPASHQPGDAEPDSEATTVTFASTPALETSDAEADAPMFEELNSPEQQALRELLEDARADLHSGDVATVKQAEIVVAYAEAQLWRAESARLNELAQQQAAAAETTLEETGAGEVELSPESAPSEVAPGGQVMVGGQLVDPEVAEALIGLQLAEARATEARAQAEAAEAQLQVYLNDPDYAAAIGAAEASINTVANVAPEGMVINLNLLQDGSLTDAQEDVAAVTEVLTSASAAVAEAEQAASALEAAADAPEGDRDSSYAEAGEYSAAAASHLSDAQLPLREFEIQDQEAYIETLGGGTEERIEAETRLEEMEASLDVLRGAQELAPANERLAEEWADLVVAQGRVEQFEDITNQLLEALEASHPQYFDPDGFTEISGQGRHAPQSTGSREGHEIIERDGQLYLQIEYANLDGPVEIQLTYAAGEGRSWRLPSVHPHQNAQPPAGAERSQEAQQLDQEWQGLISSPASTLVPTRTGLNGALDDLNVALAEFYRAQADLLGLTPEQLASPLDEIAERLAEERAVHGDGTLVPDSETPVQIEIDPNLRLDDLGSDLGHFDLPELDGKWVHPEVAEDYHRLAEAAERLRQLEAIRERALNLFLAEHSPEYFGLDDDNWELTPDEIIEEGGIVEQYGNLFLDPSVLDGSGILDGLPEVPLTFAPGDPAPNALGRSSAAEQLDQEWANMRAAYGGGGLEGARDTLAEASNDLTASLEQFGSGTTEQLTGTLPEGVEPVLVPLDGEQRFVHPDVAEALFALLDLQVQADEAEFARQQALDAAAQADFRSTQPSALRDGDVATEFEEEFQRAWDFEDIDNALNDARDRLADSMANRNAAQTSVLAAERVGLEIAHPELAPIEDLVAAGGGNNLLTGENLSPELERLLDTDIAQAWHATYLELSSLGEERTLIEQMRSLSAADRDRNEFLRDIPLAERRDPDRWGELDSSFYEENLAGSDREIDARREQLPERVIVGENLDEAIGIALGTADEAIIEPVADQIRDIGDDGDEVDIDLLIYSDDGVRPTATFEVESSTGRPWLVFEDGGRYRDLEDIQKDGPLSEHGQLYVPRLLSRPNALNVDGYEWVQAADGRSTTERIIDPLVGLGTGVATGLAVFVPVTAPLTAPLAYLGGTYLGGRSLVRLDNMRDHGRSLLTTEGLMEGAMVVTSVLPMGASAFRSLGLARAGMGTRQALAASIGAMANRAYAPHARLLMADDAGMFGVAHGLDGAAMAIGAPLLGYSGYDVVAHGADMSLLDLSNAVVGLGMGAFGTGMGYRGLRDVWPRRTMQLVIPSGQTTDARVIGGRPTGPGDVFIPGIPRITPDTGQRFQLVRTDAGDYVIPWMRHQLPWHETASATPDSSPLRPGDARAPILRHESSQDSPLSGRDEHQLNERDSGERFTIVDGTDPASPYSSLPRRYAREVTYGSDNVSAPRWPDSLFDQRTSETLFSDQTQTAQERVERYQVERRYRSAHEMSLRYGLDEPTIPAEPIRERLPDFRVGITGRMRLNAGQYLGIGSPTMISGGFGIGTKTNFADIFWAARYSVADRSSVVARNTLARELVVSLRPQEYRNITAREAGLSPTSNQTALPVRAQQLLDIGKRAIFDDTSGFDVRLREARIAGQTPDGAATVVEVTYCVSMRGDENPAPLPQQDFFGVPVESGDGFVRLQGELPFDRVMTEFKASLRLPVLASRITSVGALPRLGFEMRPEATVKDFLRSGDVLSRPAFDQIQAALATVRLKTQFAVGDHQQAADFVDTVNDRNTDAIAAVREMVSNGIVEPTTAESFVRNPFQSGFRLSAIPNRPLFREFTLPTGNREYLIDPKAMLVDIIFNDHSRLLPVSVDRIATSAVYKTRRALQSRLPASMRPDTPPQPRYMPTTENIYRSLHGDGGATPATRYTVSLSTPPLPLGPVAFSIEGRVQWKRNARPAAPTVAEDGRLPISLTRSDGRAGTLEVPTWLAHVLEIAQDGAAALIPRGARGSLDRFLGELEARADPAQCAAIAHFRQLTANTIQDTTFLRSGVADDVRDFLWTQLDVRNGASPEPDGPEPHSLSAAYHRAGEPYRSGEPSTPATFRGQVVSLPSDPIQSAAGTFSQAMAADQHLYTTPNMRMANEAIDQGALENSLTTAGVSPLTARAFAAAVGDFAETAIVAPRISSGSEPSPSFGPQRLSSWSTERIQALSLDQVRGLTTEQIAQLTPEQVAGLTRRQIKALTREQLGALTVHQLRALTRPQVRALTSRQLYEFSPGQFRKFTPEQFEWMTPFQLDTLSVEHLRIFRATHRRNVTPEQRAAIAEALSSARKSELKQSVTTFALMGTASAGLWWGLGALSAPWAVTIAGVAFGIRGGVFGLQALFPNATAANTTLGRGLNAVGAWTFISGAPGSVVAFLTPDNLTNVTWRGVDSGLANSTINGSFAFGGAVGGTQMGLMTRTGRTVLRFFSTHLALPGYVAGCALYTMQTVTNWQSWYSLIPSTAGVMFTLGCAEFYGTALRADRVNRRPVPESDADIAELSRADGQWGTLDRWTLGITFGVGMGLFSLDALLREYLDEYLDSGSESSANTTDSEFSSNSVDISERMRGLDRPQPPTLETEPMATIRRPPSERRERGERPLDLSDEIAMFRPDSPTSQTGGLFSGLAGDWQAQIGGYQRGETYRGWSTGLAGPNQEASLGRVNSELENRGYRWVDAVRSGETIGSIARKYAMSVSDTVILNMDHISDPGVIFPGDRIYLPEVAYERQAEELQLAS